MERIVAYRGFRIPPQDLPDLEQEVMTQIWQAVHRADFDPAAGFWGLVETVASRRCIDWLRSQKDRADLDPQIRDLRADPLQQTLSRERSELALAALARLPKPCRELILLHAGLGKSYREISRLVGKSEGALRVQMHRCIESARKILANLGRSSY